MKSSFICLLVSFGALLLFRTAQGPLPQLLSVETVRSVTANPDSLQDSSRDSDEDPQAAAPARIISEKRRHHVRQLIQRLMPEQSPSAVDVWIEELGALSDDEITFLLKQRQQLSGFLPSLNPVSHDDGVPIQDSNISAVPGPAASGRSVPAGSRFHTEQMNRLNASTIGYRRRMIIDRPGPEGNCRQRTTLLEFSVGDIIFTGRPLHLAITVPGPLFFQLEDGRLTRNGQFVCLADGRIGLQSDHSSVAVMNSPVISADGTCRIDSKGRVHHFSPTAVATFLSKSEQDPGRIPIVRVDAGQLTTVDGVYFESSGEAVAADDVPVISGALELSNVNAATDMPRLRFSED